MPVLYWTIFTLAGTFLPIFFINDYNINIITKFIYIFALTSIWGLVYYIHKFDRLDLSNSFDRKKVLRFTKEKRQEISLKQLKIANKMIGTTFVYFVPSVILNFPWWIDMLAIICILMIFAAKTVIIKEWIWKSLYTLRF